ncbi:NET1-associated nuclear protein 1 [Batrachochytrium dendrobatidis]|nr:NET1-associated nuclear protein 1 [Batrachochytrium dendrobatidis]
MAKKQPAEVRLQSQQKESQDLTATPAGESHADSTPVNHSKLSKKGRKEKKTTTPQSSVKTEPNNTDDGLGLWKLIPSTGGRLSNCKTIFSKNSRCFFVGNGSDVKMFAVSTGLVVRTLKLAHTADESSSVVCVAIDPHHPTQVFAAYADGVIALWDHSTGTLIKTWTTKLEISQIIINPLLQYEVFLVAHESHEKSGRSQVHEHSTVVRINLESKTVNVLFDSKKGKIICIDLALETTVLVVATTNAFHLVDHNSKRLSVRSFNVPNKIVSMAVNPAQPFVAIGDIRGCIRLWYCFNILEGQEAVSSLLHWHAHQVNDLAFTPDGTVLISGGDEAVLVLWQLETGNKQFLPRMGSEILSIGISSDQMLYAIGHRNNCVKIVSASDMSTKQAISGVRSANINLKMYPMTAGLVVDPRSSSIVLNGSPGSIQFYNASLEQSTAEVDVSPRNRITRIEDREILRPHVHHVQFSDDGEWMATVDFRDDRVFATETYLRFWRYNLDSREFVANTRVDSPHDRIVTSLRFQPRVFGQPLLAVTAGEDKLFKIWEFVEPTNDQETPTWICRSTGFYKSFVPQEIAFSEDGCVMAVAFGSIVTLWDPFTSTHQMSLAYPPAFETVTKLSFVKGHPILVAATQSCMHVWNVATTTVLWSLRAKVLQLLADPCSSQFLILAQDLDENCDVQLGMFSPYSPVPEFAYKMPSKCHGVVFSPNANGSHIVYLDSKFRFQTFIKNAAMADAQHKIAAAEAHHIEQSLFTSIYGNSVYNGLDSEETQRRSNKPIMSSKVVSNAEDLDENSALSTKSVIHALGFLEAPSHIVAAPSRLVEPFMDQLLARRIPADLTNGMDTSLVTEKASSEQPIAEVADVELIELDNVSFLDTFFSNLWITCTKTRDIPVIKSLANGTAMASQDSFKSNPVFINEKMSPDMASVKHRSKANGSVSTVAGTPLSKPVPSKIAKSSAVTPSKSSDLPITPDTANGKLSTGKKSKKRTLDITK